jgi:uncharacterized protein (DUF342 family)
MSTAKKTKKDKQVLMLVNIAHTLNFITKKTAGKILRRYKKIGAAFDPMSHMLEKKYIDKLDLIPLKNSLDAFETIQDDARFGALCISFNFLTNSNLELALKEQKLLIKQGKNIKLGELLEEAGMTSKGQRHLVLIKQKANLKAIEGLSKRTKSEGKNDFKIDMRKIREDNLIFFIQNDSLTAYLKKTESFDSATSLDKLKQLITKQGIVHGVANDEQLQFFLDSEEYLQDNYFQLAKGDASIAGIDATKKVCFQEEYKVAGKIGIDGNIDYRERGAIPSVKKNELLAEKTPAKEGESGLNIFDEIIPPEMPRDTFLKYGTGAKISEDGLRIYAEVNGYPKKERNGEIIVNEIFVIKGDVDYRTGNINYDKSVNISGSIKNGFKVNAIDIVADEVDGGILNARGNVIVRKGIIDAKIKAEGTVTASHISRSNISCFGDIVVIKEISDSRIFSDGKCRVDVGKVFASSITAKGGADIRNIGAEKAKRVALTVGTSPNYDKKLKRINKLIENKQNELEQIIYEKNNTPNEIREIMVIITNLSASIVKDRATIEQLDSADKDKNEMMHQAIEKANEKIKNLKMKKQEFEYKFQKAKEAEPVCSKIVRKLVKEKFLLKKTNQNNQPKPVVKVEGTIIAGTLVSGIYSKVIVNKQKNRVRIMETQKIEDDTQTKGFWEMIISDL